MKKLWITFGALVALMAVVITVKLVFFPEPVTYDLYVNWQPVISGTEGKGTITMEAKNDDFAAIQKTITWQVPDNGSLSNGQDVQVKADYDRDLCEKENVKITNDTFAVTVEGLLPEVVERSEADGPAISFQEHWQDNRENGKDGTNLENRSFRVADYGSLEEAVKAAQDYGNSSRQLWTIHVIADGSGQILAYDVEFQPTEE